MHCRRLWNIIGLKVMYSPKVVYIAHVHRYAFQDVFLNRQEMNLYNLQRL